MLSTDTISTSSSTSMPPPLARRATSIATDDLPEAVDPTSATRRVTVPGSELFTLGDALVMVDDLRHDESQELLGERGVEP